MLQIAQFLTIFKIYKLFCLCLFVKFYRAPSDVTGEPSRYYYIIIYHLMDFLSFLSSEI